MNPVTNVRVRQGARRESPSLQTVAAELGHDHEEVAVRRGERSGIPMIVGVHSTVLGPALGGARMWCYEAEEDAVADALRLSAAMTLKAAAAGLDLGGGKGVICLPAGAPPRGDGRRDALLDFGELVDSLKGRYVTAEDVGTSAADMSVIRERTPHVTGRPIEMGGSGDPSPFTAIGVEAAMRACVAARYGSSDLAGARVVVVGLGHVGLALAERLVRAGAEVTAGDVVGARREQAEAIGAAWVEPGEALLAECDLLAPCALGGSISGETAPALRCEIVCGCANNQLTEDGLATVLAERGVLYAPDFIVNAGGLIHVYRELRGYSEEKAVELALRIEATLTSVLETAAERGITPLAAGRELADERIHSASALQC